MFDDLLDEANGHVTGCIHQALIVTMVRMSQHIVDFLMQSPRALFRGHREIYLVKSTLRREPLPPDAMVVGLLERADDFGVPPELYPDQEGVDVF
jgi:hypothetical protein